MNQQQSPNLTDLVRDRNLPAIKALLESGHDPNGSENPYITIHPLSLACDVENPELVKLLLSYGADIHINSNGPLILTMIVGNFDQFQIIWDAGSFDVNNLLNLVPSHCILEQIENVDNNDVRCYRNSYGPTALRDAWVYGKPDAHTWPGFVLFSTIRAGNVETIQFLLANGLDLKPVADICLNWFNSRSHDILFKPFESIIRDLLDSGMGIRQIDIEHATVQAIAQLNYEYADLLLKWNPAEIGSESKSTIMNQVLTTLTKELSSSGWYHIDSLLWCFRNFDMKPVAHLIKPFIDQNLTHPPLPHYLIECLENFHKLDIDLDPYYERIMWHIMKIDPDDRKQIIRTLREIGMDYKNVADRIHALIITEFEKDVSQ